MTLFNQGNVTYATGRLLSLVSKPLVLLAVNNFYASDSAPLLAAVFLFSAICLAFSGVDAHRAYYLEQFSSSLSKKIGLFFYKYVASVVVLSISFSLIFAILFSVKSGLSFLSIMVFVFIISEKLADECLRYRIYDQKFSDWGRLSINRALLQCGLIGLSIIIMETSTVTPLVFCLALGNFITFGRGIPLAAYRVISWRGIRRKRFLPNVLKTLWNLKLLWCLAALAAVFANLDRILIYLFESKELGLFYIIVAGTSLI
ncbi:MAG: hypothetical protein VW080_12180, partial [Flavobacteriaceae bacterium]